MKFVDWTWRSYDVLRAVPDMLRKQERLLFGTGLYEGIEGIEYTFIPTKRMEETENILYSLYPGIKIIDHEIVFCNEVFSTSKIEGADTTLLRTQELHDGAKVDQSNYFSDMMVLGAFKATQYLNSVKNVVTVDSMINTWNILVDGSCNNESIRGDRFRTGGVQVGNHSGLNPLLIEDAMQCWVAYYNGGQLEEHPFIKAALLHFAFEFIHPFCDGNGRLGRLLMSNYLIKSGMDKIKAVSFSRSIEKEHMGYYVALDASDNVQTDCTPFIEYLLDRFLDAFNDVLLSSGTKPLNAF